MAARCAACQRRPPYAGGDGDLNPHLARRAGNRPRLRPAQAGAARTRPRAARASSSSSDYEPAGDQPTAIKELTEAARRRREEPGAARRHRLGQDLHHGQGHRDAAAPGAGDRAEQDPRRAALRRVQELLPRQCGRILRQLLRLLPARSLCPADRHLHREGKLERERGDRPHAPLGDAVAARARRRDHRRLGLVPLRHRLGRNLFGDDLQPQEGRSEDQREVIRKLVALQYRRNDQAFARGNFRVRGDSLEIFPSHYEDMAWRVSASSATRSRRSPSSTR